MATSVKKNNTQIKIVLQKGGFAGDLITALYDPTALINISDSGKVEIDSNRTILQNENNLSLQEKNDLLDNFKVLSICDTEFAFMHRKNSLFLYSSDKEMTEYFCRRFQKYHPSLKRFEAGVADTIVEHDEWRDYWLPKFPNSLDMSQMFEDNFIFKIPFLEVDQAKISCFEKWKTLNTIN